MKAILNESSFPKFLVVNELPEKSSTNKYLPRPWKKGELVKVAPFSDQKCNGRYDDRFKFATSPSPTEFRKRFVKIIRKDDNGEWSLTHIAGWEIFNPLTKKKK